MGTDDLGDKTAPDVAVDSATGPDSSATPSDAVDAGQTSRIFHGLLQGVTEIDLWIRAGHTPACFGITEDSAALADSFVDGSTVIPDHLKDAAMLIKGCAVCTEVLKSTVEDMGGTLPRAWQELEPASMETPLPPPTQEDQLLSEKPLQQGAPQPGPIMRTLKLEPVGEDFAYILAAIDSLKDPDQAADFIHELAKYLWELPGKRAEHLTQDIMMQRVREVAFSLGTSRFYQPGTRDIWREAMAIFEEKYMGKIYGDRAGAATVQRATRGAGVVDEALQGE